MTDAGFSSTERKELFLRLAASADGVTVADVYARARDLGDTATIEAYHNIARRLAHRALLVSVEESGVPTRYKLGAAESDAWLEEEELASIVDPDYPLIALTVWREAIQQVNDLPETVWTEIRERLATANACDLYARAIVSYCDDFHAQLSELVSRNDPDSDDHAKLRNKAESTRQMLVRLTKFGLGLSAEAVDVPQNLHDAMHALRQRRASFVDEQILREELALRIEPGAFVTEASPSITRDLLVGAVDGSSRGGLLALAGEDGDFTVAHSPMVNINTAVGQINKVLDAKGRLTNLFVRLPERPEDMQRQENRHTVMAKLLYSDLTDAQYMHAVWNAMDLVETRATDRLLRRWYTPDGKVEIPPADVVLRDGTVTPQDRDFRHYQQQDSYGQIVRDMIEVGWDVALRSREEGRAVCGVVKATQLWIYGPIINWFACRLALEERSQVKAWALESMNVVPDQVLVTRLLSAGRSRSDAWTRTCVVLRPFHAVTDYSASHNRRTPQLERILEEHSASQQTGGTTRADRQVFWQNFQGANDPYVKMLRDVQYGSFFLAAVPRLDSENLLPRFELLVTSPVDNPSSSPWASASKHVHRVLSAIKAVGFDVSADHSMFLSEQKLDVLPRLLIKAHDTVKIWAAELLTRVQEYVGYHLTKYSRLKRMKGVQVRPYSRVELEALYTELRRERERQAGANRLSADPEA